MRRTLVLGLALGALASGSASADTFAVVPSAAVQLPAAEAPNAEGAVLLPTNAFSAPLGLPETRDYESLRALWVAAGETYGIPWQVLAAINKIESNFGRNMGPSSAGAVGWMQFMPDTWTRWGADADGNGIADPWNPDDAIYSAARYLAGAGGRTDLSRSLFAYNHAQWYVDDVLRLAALFDGNGAGADVAFDLDRLGVAVEEAQQAVTAAEEALQVAEERQQPLEDAVRSADRRAADPALILSDQLAAQKVAYEVESARLTGAAEVEQLRAALGAAQSTLDDARNGAYAASFNPAAADLVGGPTLADGYVFPVGGGPALVSVGHGHHDYPAADIAAPEGSPVYALADAVVVEAGEDGRCGTGILLQTQDGLRWVYCHLSFREPTVQAGALLSAGQTVGRVGSTGNSSGPHLHLALKPETRYPQDLPWFTAFAGTAFSWQGSAAAVTVRSSPVFGAAPAAPSSPAADVVDFTLSPPGD